MITTVIEILDDNAPLLLSRCPSWTIPMVNELRDTSWAARMWAAQPLWGMWN